MKTGTMAGLFKYLSAITAAGLASCAWAGSINVTAHSKAGDPMADAVIYAMPLDTALPPLKFDTSSVAQEHLQFTPYVTVLRTGSEARFPNLDNIDHHVKSFSPAREFEIKPADKGAPPIKFDKPGVVVVYCLIHEWMRAYVYVVETPYFGKSEAAGTVALDNLPPGNYELRAWHPDMGTIKPPLQQTVKIGADGVQQVKFDFDFIPKKRKPARTS
ncbi:MAG: methylamine utilization protein [Burkholderiaceae bacterium]|nr:methylamine utilization protein [Burkholderiaceae bacterium]